MCHVLNLTQCILKGMLVIPYKPVHVLLFSQLRLKGNAKLYGNHLPEEIPEEIHVPVAEGISKEVWFSYTFFEYFCDLLTVGSVNQVAQVQMTKEWLPF